MRDGARGESAVSEVTITEAVVGAAAGYAGAALIDVGPDERLSHAEFAALVPAAAAGLALRGVRPGDVGVVQVPGAGDFALALHALTAAGAIPVPVAAELPAGELAALLIRSEARILVTAEPYTTLAVEAADRSYVRQVFAFGCTDAAGATPFDELLAGRPGGGPPVELPKLDPLRDIALRTYDPAEELTHADRLADLCRLAAIIEPGTDDVLVGCAAFCTAPTWAGVVDAVLMRGATLVAVGDPAPAALLQAVVEHGATIAILDGAALRYAAYDHSGPLPMLRILTTAPVPPDVARRLPAVVMPT